MISRIISLVPALPVPIPGRDREVRLDMYSRYDPNEYYIWRFNTKGSINKVWARVNESGFCRGLIYQAHCTRIR
jgi:hypothetical protein